jgi:hypothetical protein
MKLGGNLLVSQHLEEPLAAFDRDRRVGHAMKQYRRRDGCRDAIALVVTGICSAAASSAGSNAEIPAALKNQRRVKAVMAGKV